MSLILNPILDFDKAEHDIFHDNRGFGFGQFLESAIYLCEPDGPQFRERDGQVVVEHADDVHQVGSVKVAQGFRDLAPMQFARICPLEFARPLLEARGVGPELE